MKFTEGQEVLARHPETQKYHKGTILSTQGDRCIIQFEPDMEHIVHQDDIKAGRASRSLTRTSTRMGRKSPSRYSPSRRSPSRRSPSRKSPTRRSPTKRSPGRSPISGNKRLPVRTSKHAKVSLPRIDAPTEKAINAKIENTINTSEEDNTTDVMPLQSRLKDKGTMSRRSTRLFSGMLNPESEHNMIMLSRNINRAVSLPLERKRQVHDFVIDGKERGYSVQRDQDLTKSMNYEEDAETDSQIAEKRKKEINFVNEPQEWGGWVGTLILMVLSPIIFIVPNMMCTKDQCRSGYFELPTDLNSYMHLEAFYAWIGFAFYVVCFSLIPIGKCVDGQNSRIGRLQYRLNGFLSTVVAVIIYIICTHRGMKISDFILDNITQLSVCGFILGTILSFVLYVKASRAPVVNLNIHASTNSVIYNFYQGREINPRFGPVDVKINIFRITLIATIFINLACIIKVIEEAPSFSIEHMNVPAMISAIFQIFYMLDALYFEVAYLSSFEVVYEGLGFMLALGYMVYPFVPALTTRYILYNKVEFSYWLGPIICFYIIGYLIFRISNLEKHEFRRNPLSPAVAHLETIPTSRGRKLIVSGLWGFVRHPNYLGDLMIAWAMSATSLKCDVLPYFYPIGLTCLLLHRAIRDNERCKMRYGYAWEQYTSRVPYMILYGIF